MPDIHDLKLEFLEHMEIEKNRSQKTIERYDFCLEAFLQWTEIDTPSEIDAALIKRFRTHLHRKKTTNGEELAIRTQNHYVIALRSFLKYLVKQKVKTFPPEQIELAKETEAKIEILTEDELDRLFEASKPTSNSIINHRNHAFVMTLYSTGLRVSEIVSMDIEHLNNKTGEFYIRGKRGKIRPAFLSNDARAAINAYLKHRSDNDDALFINHSKNCDPNNRRMTARTAQRIIQKIATSAGIVRNVYPHMIRHNFATNLLNNGADIRSVQAILGHSSIQTTQRYTHITNKQLREVHKRFHNKNNEAE